MSAGQAVATLPPDARVSFATDLCAALKVSAKSSMTKYHNAQDTIFGIWAHFCQDHDVEPTLRNVAGQEDKLCYLLVFGMQYRCTGQGQNQV